MLETLPISKNKKNGLQTNLSHTQSITLDIQTAINSDTFRSILSFCKQWNIKDIYIKLQNLNKPDVLDHIIHAIADTFLFSSDDFKFYLFYENLENYIIKKLWTSNVDAKEFLLPFFIHTADYEILDESLGIDIVNFYNDQPEIYRVKPEKKQIILDIKYPQHVCAVLMKTESKSENETNDLIDVTDNFDFINGRLAIQWKKDAEVSIYVLRKIYSWNDSVIQKKINIFSTKFYLSYLNYLNEHFNKYSSFFSGWVFNPLITFPKLSRVIPIKSDILKIFSEQTDKNYAKTAISCWHNIFDNSHHQCYDFYNFNRVQILNAINSNITKFVKTNQKQLKFLFADSGVENNNYIFEHQLFDFSKSLDELELQLSSKTINPEGDFAKIKELQLRIASSITHHHQNKKAVIHCDDLLNTYSKFENKIWQFNWLISCGVTNFNYSVDYSETEADANLYNDLPTFDPSFNAYEKWFSYINQMADFALKGIHRCDVLLIYPSDSYCCGNVTDSGKITQTLSNAAIDFDIIDFDNFTDNNFCKIHENRFQINSEQYSILILPGIEVIPLDVLRKIYNYYSAGGTVIAIGGLPSKSCEWDKDNEIEGISNEIWFKKSSISSTNFKTNKWGGKGYFQSNIKVLPEIILDNKKLLNFYIETEHNNIHTLIRELPREYYLFFFNLSATNIFEGTIFSKYKGQPFNWNFDSEKREPLYKFKIKDKFMQFNLQIPPKQARLIILKKESLKEIPKIVDSNITDIDSILTSRAKMQLSGSVAKDDKYYAKLSIHHLVKDAAINIGKFLPVLKISDQNWNIEYNEKKVLGSLNKLNRFEQAFCGSISYKKIIIILNEYLSGYKLILDLGEVRDSVEVFINKKKVGILINPPYTIDITNYLVEGDNIFNFRVNNNLSNKLSQFAFNQNNGFLVKEFGLIGPVKIIPKKKIELNF